MLRRNSRNFDCKTADLGNSIPNTFLIFKKPNPTQDKNGFSDSSSNVSSGSFLDLYFLRLW
ncbi:hypothetical protein DQM68_09300 [Leptospira mayottensis]|uniref:Uncharacterized protein n=1 Tax=Leptospira mayottensis TaxID=1137606 RepID=A0ABM6Y9M2_9LEPT|nr:hypothetical protein DQM68_09300 [Leptospira mayottensis]AXR64729.1 hypothetical protein DQM28_11385 [Leptospira mayottensis]AXR68431.1 hypothetical protein DPV73_10770 [Leptospira mayottensis]AZQ02716.1 hypothetical protein LEP1GSC190_12390 [Leptospira mayottensis 200901116]TGM99991.1 hypothetical protein EHR03_13565 [Leptospira mayottensis]